MPIPNAYIGYVWSTLRSRFLNGFVQVLNTKVCKKSTSKSIFIAKPAIYEVTNIQKANCLQIPQWVWAQQETVTLNDQF